MRDIKFRAWDKDKKRMVKVKSIHFMDLESCIVVNPFEFISLEHVEIMQYTGLKDKNGVEIYDGDIVQACSQGVKGNFEVKWRQEGSPGWVLFPAWQSSQMWHLHAIETEKGKYQDSVTVIGNRFENPELLKEEPTC